MNRGYSGSNYDRHVENTNTSTFHKMKETYWTTKQAVIKKLGKKEDEHVVASDSQLDAKLEVFKAIQKSSMDLLRVIERYQDRLCVISMEENAMGRFLKSHSNADKTRAGKMMAAVGKSQSFSAQQRLALRVPLVRLYQEVETFRYRAISDTLVTINRMEGARTEYRGALLWMKNVSEELDPDTYKQLEKFRTVQTQVRKTKSKFDKLKLDVMQKVDLLAASRCNMFSHVLANYQTTLLHFWEKTSRTMSAVAESFKGYQYYEFNMLKELAEPCRELSEKTSQRQIAEKDTDDQDRENSGSYESEEEEDNSDTQPVKLTSNCQEIDRLLSLDDENTTNDSKTSDQSTPSLLQLANQQTHSNSDDKKDLDDDFGPFIDFGDEDKTIEDIEKEIENFDFSGKTILSSKSKEKKSDGPKDLLVDDIEEDNTDKDDMTLLNEIMNAPSTGGDEFTQEWQAVFGVNQLSTSTGSVLTAESDQPKTPAEFMPSSLLDMSSLMTEQASNPVNGNGTDLLGAIGGNQKMLPPSSGQPAQIKSKSQPQSKKSQKSDMSAWFNLFADLDPLSNPDAIGRKPNEITEM
ncbi:islet cell autoantigen 1 isoform X1 [Patella vulgata]|uniref:islet cell autoantigen 1 isoform X1 n=1 Tax=Patella vulgata TaxID=6465 RepID=UPI00217F2DCB|nr:islet cell autoantigen 1 isoform X1 [Patella vulgata]XP_055959299.1 islet cell autoantigen 1 isoform X1 [Patella vulgata]